MLTELFLLLKPYGYAGIFLITLIDSATVLFPIPIPSAIFVFGLGPMLNPLLVGMFAGLGAALGEFTGYALGMGGRRIIKKKWKKQVDNVEKLFAKYGGFFILLIFAATPLPDDISGIVAGILKYPAKKYFLAVLIGKIILNVALAYAGFYGIKGILSYF
jgi:membrane protein DedA with SNARE-associated domain